MEISQSPMRRVVAPFHGHFDSPAFSKWIMFQTSSSWWGLLNLFHTLNGCAVSIQIVTIDGGSILHPIGFITIPCGWRYEGGNTSQLGGWNNRQLPLAFSTTLVGNPSNYAWVDGDVLPDSFAVWSHLGLGWFCKGLFVQSQVSCLPCTLHIITPKYSEI